MKNKNNNVKQIKQINLTPSPFGSHSSMINSELSPATGDVVILTDEYGDYKTTRDRLDSGLADPNRYQDFQAIGEATSISASNFIKRQNKVEEFLNPSI